MSKHEKITEDELDERMAVGNWFHKPGAASGKPFLAADDSDLDENLGWVRQMLSSAEQSPRRDWEYGDKQQGK